MNRRVAIIILTFAAIFSGIACVVAYIYSTEPKSISARIDWAAYQIPSCSSVVKTVCIISINVLAFRPDGSMLMIASDLQPTTTRVEATLPEEGIYTFWVVASGMNEQGEFITSPPCIETVEVTSNGVIQIESKTSNETPPMNQI